MNMEVKKKNRNFISRIDKKGWNMQQHITGGRIKSKKFYHNILIHTTQEWNIYALAVHDYTVEVMSANIGWV